jgi:hypothetical protein
MEHGLGVRYGVQLWRGADSGAGDVDVKRLAISKMLS